MKTSYGIYFDVGTNFNSSIIIFIKIFVEYIFTKRKNFRSNVNKKIKPIEKFYTYIFLMFLYFNGAVHKCVLCTPCVW